MIEWIPSTGLTHYDAAVTAMEKRVADIRLGDASEAVWLVEHPPLYTAGTSAKASDLLHAQFPVHQTGRGGQYTYHGPGQRVAYVMVDLAARGGDIRRYVQDLEEWIIRTLAHFGITGERREGRVGIWVRSSSEAVAHHEHPRSSSPSSNSEAIGHDKAVAHRNAVAHNLQVESKIAAIGVRVRSGVTYHGIAINVSPDLSHFNGIVPCGIAEFGVTSLHDLGVKINLQELDRILQVQFASVFGA